MVIPGLKTFLRKNPTLRETTELSSSRLVIEAKALCNHLFKQVCLNGNPKRSDLYGGDLVAFGEIIAQFFTALEQCDITPIMVYDGDFLKSPHDKITTRATLELKSKLLSDLVTELKTLAKLSESNPGSKPIMNQLLLPILKMSLPSHVKEFRTPFKENSYSARVAKAMKAPILTDNEELILYPIESHFIFIEDFQFKHLKMNKYRRHIECSVYKQIYLLKHFPGLNPTTLAFVGLLDIDFTPNYSHLTKMIPQKVYSGHLKLPLASNKTLVNFLYWLAGQSWQQAVEAISCGQREMLETNLCKKSMHEQGNFKDELQANLKDEREIAHLDEMAKSGSLSTALASLIASNVYKELPALDDQSKSSANSVKLRPYAVCLSLLSSARGSTSGPYIYDRAPSSLCILANDISVAINLEGCRPLGEFRISNIMFLDPEERKLILLATFRSNKLSWDAIQSVMETLFEEDFKHQASISFLLMSYIVSETKQEPLEEFLDSLLLVICFYAAYHHQLKSEILPIQDQSILLSNINRLADSPWPKLDEQEYRLILHMINQLHAAYWSYDMLNSLLGKPIKNANPGKFLNGFYIYALTSNLFTKEIDLASFCPPKLSYICNQVHCLVSGSNIS